jgi:excisionase family DNA binding protein
MNPTVVADSPKIEFVSTIQRGFRIREASVYMGLSPWTVEVLIREKKLPAIKLSRHYTILKEDMDAFLERSKRAS